MFLLPSQRTSMHQISSSGDKYGFGIEKSNCSGHFQRKQVLREIDSQLRFLFVDGDKSSTCKNVANDTLFRDEVCPNLRLNSVRNRNRQDIESVVELGSPVIRSILTRSVKKITHTFVAEKIRQKKVCLYIPLVFAAEIWASCTCLI